MTVVHHREMVRTENGSRRCLLFDDRESEDRPQRRTFHSKDVKHVSQVVKPTITEKFVVVTTEGSPARLEIRLCSDPKPRLVAWEWGSTRLHAG